MLNKGNGCHFFPIFCTWNTFSKLWPEGSRLVQCKTTSQACNKVPGVLEQRVILNFWLFISLLLETPGMMLQVCLYRCYRNYQYTRPDLVRTNSIFQARKVLSSAADCGLVWVWEGSNKFCCLVDTQAVVVSLDRLSSSWKLYCIYPATCWDFSVFLIAKGWVLLRFSLFPSLYHFPPKTALKLLYFHIGSKVAVPSAVACVWSVNTYTKYDIFQCSRCFIMMDYWCTYWG